MAGEGDQAKWVGVRPIDPPENLPVDLKVATASVKVEPKTAGTQFKTLTQKLAPAISDLQAVEAILQHYEAKVLTATATYIKAFGNVPGGKIWIITNALAYSPNVGSAIRIDILENATIKCRLDYKITTAAYTFCGYPGIIVLDEGQKLSFEFYGYANGNTCYSSCVGYQISKY